ncbi:MAG: hypothetical protein QME74_03885 [Candidatus Edwardsbacteria bacterium]|nr:hypothetical protein [Candidatus Edwardsbacteria bacterium]
MGTIRDGGARFYADTPTHQRVLALEYATADNRISPLSSLELNQESFDIGVYAPLTPVEPKLALSLNRYAQGEDYWALGFYPRLPIGPTRLSLSLERDADGTTHTGGSIRNDWNQVSLIGGYSRERAESHGGPIDEERYGAIVEKELALFFLHTAVGGAVNRQAAPTWVLGLYRPADPDRAGVNPAVLLMARRKPEADYALGIVSLWGKVLREGICTSITESFLTGALSRSRVVRNRDFNTPGVGGGYDAMDFGKLVATYTLVDVDAGGPHLRESQAGLYGTLPRSHGPIHNPFLGLEYTTATDLTHNPIIRSLDDWGQAWTTVTTGFKLHVNQTVDPSPRKRPGYLRLQLSVRIAHSIDGVYATATIWQ